MVQTEATQQLGASLLRRGDQKRLAWLFGQNLRSTGTDDLLQRREHSGEVTV